MDELATLLFAASEGERKAVLKFLRAFKEAKLITINREQTPALTSNAKYPNRPLDIFAIQDGENTVIPAFSDLSLLENWTNRPIKARIISTQDLIKIMPEDWWLILNPGDEARKDFSPWELKKIIGDEADLLEIATELELEYSPSPIVIRKLSKDEFSEIKKMLNDYLLAKESIQEIYLGVEESKTVEETTIETLLVGIKIKETDKIDAQHMRSEIKDLIAPMLIGSMQIRILQGIGFNDLELGIFADIAPEITRSQG